MSDKPYVEYKYLKDYQGKCVAVTEDEVLRMAGVIQAERDVKNKIDRGWAATIMQHKNTTEGTMLGKFELKEYDDAGKLMGTQLMRTLEQLEKTVSYRVKNDSARKIAENTAKIKELDNEINTYKELYENLTNARFALRNELVTENLKLAK